MDLYLPDQPRGPVPFVLFAHGGGWIVFDRKLNASLGRTLAAHGIALVSPGYRLLPAVSRQTQRGDVVDAIRHVLGAFAQEHGLDSRRWVLGGESAGAHLALRALQDEHAGLPVPRGFLGLFGYYDVRHPAGPRLPRFRTLLAALRQGDSADSAAEDHTALRPLAHPVPVMLLHGEADTVAPADQSRRLHRYLQGQGNACELHTYPGADHGFLYRLYGPERVQAQRAYRRIFRFLLGLGFGTQRQSRAGLGEDAAANL